MPDSKVDFNEVGLLLHIVEKASAHGASLGTIIGVATARLREINTELGKPTDDVAPAADELPPPVEKEPTP